MILGDCFFLLSTVKECLLLGHTRAKGLLAEEIDDLLAVAGLKYEGPHDNNDNNGVLDLQFVSH